MAPASFFGSALMQKPSIGASMASAPIAGSITGKLNRSTSSRSFCGNWSMRKVPSRYMPAFFCCSACAASCQVRPSGSAWCSGSSCCQVSKTFLTSALSQEPLPAIRSMWNW